MTENPALTEALASFAPRARDVLSGLPASGGVLEPPDARAVGDIEGIGPADLMVSLLPVAEVFASPGISRYRVGAVAASPPVEGVWGRLYVGGNVEFPGEALGLTLHAEQSVTLNALFGGESALAALAVSAPPCGHCRQFLNEMAAPPDVITVSEDGAGMVAHSMDQLLPSAFGPADLGVDAALLDRRRMEIVLDGAAEESPLIGQALLAAQYSYAPYTGSHAGCALRTEQGTVHVGGYIENAAFNPSVLAIQSALLHLHLKGPGLEAGRISEVALVEVEGPTAQLSVTRRLLAVVAPRATLSYQTARMR